MQVLEAMTENTRARFHDEKEKPQRRWRDIKCVEPWTARTITAWIDSPWGSASEGHVLKVLSSGIRIDAYYINQARIHELSSREGRE